MQRIFSKGTIVKALIHGFISVNFARIVPDGLLVFFPSYYMMNQCIECWKSMVWCYNCSIFIILILFGSD